MSLQIHPGPAACRSCGSMSVITIRCGSPVSSSCSLWGSPAPLGKRPDRNLRSGRRLGRDCIRGSTDNRARGCMTPSGSERVSTLDVIRVSNRNSICPCATRGHPMLGACRQHMPASIARLSRALERPGSEETSTIQGWSMFCRVSGSEDESRHAPGWKLELHIRWSPRAATRPTPLWSWTRSVLPVDLRFRVYPRGATPIGSRGRLSDISGQ
jgi:hypothetical protein